MAGRPRGFYTDLGHGVIYHAGSPEILLVPAEAARRLPEVVARSLGEMGLVRIPVAKLEELVERVSRWLTTRMVEESAQEIEQAFRERCYLAAVPGHISLVLRNPRESDGGEVVKVRMVVEHREVVDGRGFGFGAERMMTPWFEFVLFFLAAMSGSILGARIGYRRLEKRQAELENRMAQLEAWVIELRGRARGEDWTE